MSHAHVIRCPIPTCSYSETVEQPVDYVPTFLAHEASNALHRKVEAMTARHADEHTGAEWWSACNYYVAHLDREVARSHATRLRTGPAVWTTAADTQVDVMIVHVGAAGVIANVGDAQMHMTDPDVLAQVTMVQVRHA